MAVPGSSSRDNHEEEIAHDVSAWMGQVEILLRMLNGAIEHMELKESLSPGERALAKKLPGLIRQRLSGVPSPEMIQTWVRVLARRSPATPQVHRGKHK